MFSIIYINFLILHYSNKKTYSTSIKLESKTFLAFITKLGSMVEIVLELFVFNCDFDDSNPSCAIQKIN